MQSYSSAQTLATSWLEISTCCPLRSARLVDGRTGISDLAGCDSGRFHGLGAPMREMSFLTVGLMTLLSCENKGREPQTLRALDSARAVSLATERIQGGADSATELGVRCLTWVADGA